MFRKIISVMLSLALIAGLAIPAFAAEATPCAIRNGNNSISFTNLDELHVNEVVEYEVIDAEGKPATVGIELVGTESTGLSRASTSKTFKVYWYGITINCEFYMTVTNNKVTSVYDPWILIVGGTFDNDSLTKTATYGKLSFKMEAYAGIVGSLCWIKGTVTGSDNEITVSYKM